MARIPVTVRSDQGDLGVHPKYGALTPGATLIIEEADYSEQLFAKPNRKSKEVKDHA